MAKFHANQATALVGTPFRLQGRGPGGLDCIGLALRVFDLPDEHVRNDYRLRDRLDQRSEQMIRQFFLRVRTGSTKPGDLLLLAAPANQVHFAVKTARGFVHAHAGLRQVVETPGQPAWPIIGVFRRRASKG